MLIQYEKKRFNKDSIDKIEKANEIIGDYSQRGYILTLRQLYYQFVSKGFIPNNNRAYKALGNVISNGRLAGLISWNAIVDRTRRFNSNSHWANPSAVLQSAKDSYAIDMWENQPNHVEVWIEKEALVDVIARVCSNLDVMYFACRGFVSQSAAWRAARRVREKRYDGKHIHILHLGDHDPSGIDMTRDIEARFEVFGERISMNRLALNMDQIRELNPPPNPAKGTDARYGSYVEEFGDECWELDALDPDYINELVENEILNLRDPDLYDEMQAKLDRHNEILDKAITEADRMIYEGEDNDDD